MRAKVIELHKVMCKSIHCNYDEFQDAFAIDTLVTAENLLANGVVIPVRCKNCKHMVEFNGGVWCTSEHGIRGKLKADDFCSYGKHEKVDGIYETT